MNDLLVMKFGGTSVGSAERMRVAAWHWRGAKPNSGRTLLVVSAMSKITDLLIDCDAARRGRRPRRARRRYRRLLEERPPGAGRELLPADRQAAALAGIEELLAGFRRITAACCC